MNLSHELMPLLKAPVDQSIQLAQTLSHDLIPQLNEEQNQFIQFAEALEIEHNTDRDDDGISNISDNCIDDPNPKQQDSDKDGIGNACDTKGGKQKDQERGPKGPGLQSITPDDSGQVPQFNIMESGMSNSTYGKQGYSSGHTSMGTFLTSTNSENVCGLSLCSEKLNMQQRIDLYLKTLRFE